MAVGAPIPVPKLAPSDPAFPVTVRRGAAARRRPLQRLEGGRGRVRCPAHPSTPPSPPRPAPPIFAPAAAQVDAALQQLVDATYDLFERYKAQYPAYKDRVLKIV